MPRKRSVEERMAEAKAKLNDLELEKAIKDMRIRREERRGGRARRRR